jgi:predicted DsbA family dithiol-disulfide isomerase
MKVEVWSDVACPWCYVGKRRFEAALAAFPHRDDVVLVWRSFELDASAPESPHVAGDYAERLARKYGRGLDAARHMIDTMTETAAAHGLDFRFDRMRPGNTFDAHRLLHLGLERGVQDDLKERLDAATFTDGLRVQRPRVARRGGRRGRARRRRGARRPGLRPLRRRRPRRRGAGRGVRISGVPFFVVDGRYAISGAQPAELIAQALDTAWRDRQPSRAARRRTAPARRRRLRRLDAGAGGSAAPGR